MNVNYWITDMGESLTIRNESGAKVGVLDRYAVWADSPRDKAEVVETSNDFQYLSEKYNVDVIIPIKKDSEKESRR